MCNKIKLFLFTIVILIFTLLPACKISEIESENKVSKSPDIKLTESPATLLTTPAPTPTPTATPTPTPVLTPTPTPTAISTPTPVLTPTPTPTATSTPTPVPTPTSTPTATSTPTPTATSTPTPVPTPEPEEGVGLYFSPEYVVLIHDMWPVENTSIHEFETDYDLQVAIDYSINFHQSCYIFKTQKTIAELKTQVGNLVFGEPLTEMNRNGNYLGETNDHGDPLSVMLYLEERPSTNYIVLYFRNDFAPDNYILLFEFLEMYIVDNRIITDGLPPEKTTGEGFAYDTETGESVVWRYWKLEKSEALNLLDQYKETYKNYPEFIDGTNSSSNPKYISFAYDIWDNGDTKCIAYVHVYSDGTFRIAFGTRNKFQ